MGQGRPQEKFHRLLRIGGVRGSQSVAILSGALRGLSAGVEEEIFSSPAPGRGQSVSVRCVSLVLETAPALGGM